MDEYNNSDNDMLENLVRICNMTDEEFDEYITELEKNQNLE